jgi:hypothetical protein
MMLSSLMSCAGHPEGVQDSAEAAGATPSTITMPVWEDFTEQTNKNWHAGSRRCKGDPGSGHSVARRVAPRRRTGRGGRSPHDVPPDCGQRVVPTLLHAGH